MPITPPNDNRQEIRKKFRPAKVKILFVGESPPANGGFFYVSSPMTAYMARVFANTFGERFQSLGEFLNYFKAKGYFLDDLSHQPVDNMPRQKRRRVLANSVAQFAKRLTEYQPGCIIAVLKSIEGDVCRAVRIANLAVPIHAVPFPGQGHQQLVQAAER